MENPLISVVVPSYNRATTIKRALLSVSGQDYPNLEIVLVDDGSSDDTEALVKSFNIPNLKYIRHEVNLGANAARNSGIRAAEGEFVAFQDSDDTWKNGKLTRQMLALQPHDASIGFCAFERNQKGNFQQIPKQGYRIKPGLSDRFEEIIQGSFISTQTLIARKRVLLEVGLFDEALPRLQDWELCLRLAKRHPIVYSEEALVQAEMSSDSISRNVPKLVKAADIILEKHAEDFKARPVAAAMLCTNVSIEALRRGHFLAFMRFFSRALGHGGLRYPVALQSLWLRR